VTPLQIQRTRATIETELGTEAQCSRCREFFPADREFFFASKGFIHSWCKACANDMPSMVAKAERRKHNRTAERAAQ
jgi:hypothetical protein